MAAWKGTEAAHKLMHLDMDNPRKSVEEGVLKSLMSKKRFLKNSYSTGRVLPMKNSGEWLSFVYSFLLLARVKKNPEDFETGHTHDIVTGHIPGDDDDDDDDDEDERLNRVHFRYLEAINGVAKPGNGLGTSAATWSLVMWTEYLVMRISLTKTSKK